METMNRRKTKGLWLWKPAGVIPPGQAMPPVDLFLLEDRLITLRLIPVSLSLDSPKDGFYKLKAKYDEDTLLFLPPAGDWTPLAVLREETLFPIGGNGEYHKAKPDELEDEQKSILNIRSPWAYADGNDEEDTLRD